MNMIYEGCDIVANTLEYFPREELDFSLADDLEGTLLCIAYANNEKILILLENDKKNFMISINLS